MRVNIPTVLRETKTIAVVGCTPKEGTTATGIARYLQRVGYRVVPINRHHDRLLDEPCYPNLVSIPEDVRVDLVNIFRKPQFTVNTVQEAVERLKRTGQRPMIWTQIGVHSPEAERLAEQNGLPYVADRCILVEHGRSR